MVALSMKSDRSDVVRQIGVVVIDIVVRRVVAAAIAARRVAEHVASAGDG